MFFCFFFFQAEDGIRDRNVTGVQTCALPISGPAAHVAADVFHAGGDVRGGSGVIVLPCGAGKTIRSEERRVGKEWRYRWAGWAWSIGGRVMMVPGIGVMKGL